MTKTVYVVQQRSKTFRGWSRYASGLTLKQARQLIGILADIKQPSEMRQRIVKHTGEVVE